MATDDERLRETKLAYLNDYGDAVQAAIMFCRDALVELHQRRGKLERDNAIGAAKELFGLNEDQVSRVQEHI